RGSVSKQKAVAAERIIRGAILEVAAIGQETTALGKACTNCLVYPVPEKTALVHGVALFQRQVVHEAAGGISHGMGVFAQQEWLFRCGAEIRLYLMGFGVHPAFKVRGTVKASILEYSFILNSTAGISFAEILRHIVDRLSA